MRTLAFTTADGLSREISLRRDDEGDGFFAAKLEDETLNLELQSLKPGVGWLRIHGKITPYHAIRIKNEWRVWIGGRIFVLRIADRSIRAKPSSAAAKGTTLSAPMPGSVLKILVSSGDSFDAHQPLIILESMKMELTLSSPHEGTIKNLACAVGELVAMGQTLAEFESGDGHDSPA